MFNALSDPFHHLFKRIRGEARLSEDNMRDAVREVRRALIEADVHLQVVKDFVAHVREKALDAEVLSAVRPGQMFIKIVHDELVETMGGQAAPFDLTKGRMNVILLLGLQGSGKTTFAGKLARRALDDGFRPMLIACDIHRPAAIEQLKVVGQGVGVPVFEMGVKSKAHKIAAKGLKAAAKEDCDVAIVDTAGRLHVDEIRMDELQAIKDAVKPRYSFFVADAMTGQDAVRSAETFHKGIGIDGVCLTKLDGDARGGAALSIRAVTGRPIYFAGVGECSEDLEPFHPDRLASRILGMGDVVTLVEKAQDVVDEQQALEMQAKLKREQFSLQDFLDQMAQVKKMGSIKSLMGMLPGVGQQIKDMDIDDADFKPMEALIHSMTPAERERPELLDASRRKRIARGSGRQVAELNAMLREFQQTRKMMAQMMRQMGGGGGGMLKGLLGGGAPALPAGDAPPLPLGPPSGGGGGAAATRLKPKHRRKRQTKKTQKKRRKR